MLSETIQHVQKLTADEISARLAALSAEERTLRVLLRSIRARERAAAQQAQLAQRKLTGVKNREGRPCRPN